MIRIHLHSQRIKTIKTITRSSMDFFLIYKCLQLARKKILPPPAPPFTSFCLCATISECFNIFPFCLPETILNFTAKAFHFFWHFNWILISCKQNEGQPFFVDGLKILLRRRPYRYFSIYLKVIYACLIATRFSPVIDYELKFVKM